MIFFNGDRGMMISLNQDFLRYVQPWNLKFGQARPIQAYKKGNGREDAKYGRDHEAKKIFAITSYPCRSITRTMDKYEASLVEIT
jgi:hypothetical protein